MSAAASSRNLNEEPFMLDGRGYAAEEIIRGLEPFLTEHRRERIRQVVAGRTYSIVPVVEGLYDRGNTSAVLRTAEALGYQSVHIIELLTRFKEANRITQGADKWLDVVTWSATVECIGHLRSRGYRILAAHTADARPIHEMDFSQPAAVCFGNEKEGISTTLLDRADERVIVPMSGFTQSFNISVAAAVSLYHIAEDRRRRLGRHGDLSEHEQQCLVAAYYLRCVPEPAHILHRLTVK